MPNYTDNYNLILPEQNENYDVGVANTNNAIIDAELAKRVEKVPGKGLSTNDFTNEHKKKLESLVKGRGISSITEYYLAAPQAEITWDGDITDRENIGGQFYKVSDLTPTKEELVGQTLEINTKGEIQSNTIPEEAITDIDDGSGNMDNIFAVSMYVYVIRKSFTIDGSTYSPGVYFFGLSFTDGSAYVSKLTVQYPANITTETKGWTTEVQKIDNINKYLWNYKVTTYTDGETTTTEPVIIGTYGDKGDTGATPNIQVGTVTTLEAGSSATVTNTGTTEKPVFNFGIPQGEKGESEFTTLTGTVYIGDLKTGNYYLNQAELAIDYIISDGTINKSIKQNGFLNVMSKLFGPEEIGANGSMGWIKFTFEGLRDSALTPVPGYNDENYDDYGFYFGRCDYFSIPDHEMDNNYNRSLVWVSYGNLKDLTELTLTRMDNLTTPITPLVGANNTDYGDSYYYKVGSKVHVHLALSGLTANAENTVFTLPEGFVPYSAIGFTGSGQSLSEIIGGKVTSDGNIVLYPKSEYALCDFEYNATQ